MLLSPDVLRALLSLCLSGMAILAASYLMRRDLTPRQTFLWGLLIVLAPLVGPFLVILSHPGKPKAGLPPLPPFPWKPLE